MTKSRYNPKYNINYKIKYQKILPLPIYLQIYKTSKINYYPELVLLFIDNVNLYKYMNIFISDK